MKLIPYVFLEGKWTVSDEALTALYAQVVNEGLDKIVYYERAIMGPKEFIDGMKSPGNVPVFITEDDYITGFAWVNGVTGKRAFAHFCFLKSTWGKKTYEMGRLVLDYWFWLPGNDGPVFEVLLGCTPTWNVAAIKYIKRLGFIEVGEIPLICNGSPCLITYKVSDYGRNTDCSRNSRGGV